MCYDLQKTQHHVIVIRNANEARVPQISFEPSDSSDTTEPHCAVDMPYDPDTTELKGYLTDNDSRPVTDVEPLLKPESLKRVPDIPTTEPLVPLEVDVMDPPVDIRPAAASTNVADFSDAAHRLPAVQPVISPDGSPVSSSSAGLQCHVDERMLIYL